MEKPNTILQKKTFFNGALFFVLVFEVLLLVLPVVLSTIIYNTCGHSVYDSDAALRLAIKSTQTLFFWRCATLAPLFGLVASVLVKRTCFKIGLLFLVYLLHFALLLPFIGTEAIAFSDPIHGFPLYWGIALVLALGLSFLLTKLFPATFLRRKEQDGE